MTTRLFKYATASIGLTILKSRTLRWRAPDWFNDPFEFKSPFQYGFEWDELIEAAVRRFATILTQSEEPRFVQGYQSAANIAERRRECKGRDPAEVYDKIRPAFAHHFEKMFKEGARSDGKNWHEMKQTYRVLCLSAVHDHFDVVSLCRWASRRRPRIQIDNRTRYGDSLCTSCSLLNRGTGRCDLGTICWIPNRGEPQA